MVKVLNAENFENEVLKAEETVLVDFYADWCGPCKMMAPAIDKMSEEMKNIKFGKVNVDENSELAEKYNVMSIPTLIVFKGGNPQKGFVGVTSKDEIKTALDLIENNN